MDCRPRLGLLTAVGFQGRRVTRACRRRTIACVNALLRAAFVSSMLVLPLLLLEMRNGRAWPAIPVPLFATLWVVAFAALLLLTLVVRSPRAAVLYPSLAGAGTLAVLWIVIVRDQWPCFLGVPNCD